MQKAILITAVLGCTILASGQVKNPKKGMAFGYHSEEDLQAISGSVSWWYNWANTPESSVAGIYESYDMEFVPMTWNNSYDVSKLRDFYTSHPEAKFLLGFNEPNFRDQANMTPSEAAAAWPGLEAIADEFGLELVGPAVNWCGNCVSEDGTTFTNPYEYLDAFFAACSGCRVDYIAVHNYMCYAGPLIDYLDGFRKYDKKIWLTEFACWDQPSITLDMQKDLVIGALDHLDNDTLIYRYSWFTGRSGAGTPHIDLFESEPGKLSELGALYVNYNPVHDTSIYIPVPDRIEAENYSTMSGIALQGTSDFDGLANVGWIDGGDWLEYNIEVSETGDYFLYLRISANAASSVDVLVEDTLATEVPVTSTGGWQKWKTLEAMVYLEKGQQKIRLHTPTGDFNINWLTISSRENNNPSVNAGENQEVVSPETTVLLVGQASDPDGDSLVYRWTQVGGASCTIESPDQMATNINGLKPGYFTFRLTVSDGYDIKYDDVRITVVESTLGMDQLAEQRLRIYPNPVSDLLRVDLPEGSGAYMLEVINTVGQVMFACPASESVPEIEIDMSHFENGFYMIRVETYQGTHTSHIIKSKK